mgnify:CR=1 FL=1
MHHSIRPFIGSKNFFESKAFYTDLGFQESPIATGFSYFKINHTIGFYLQDAFVEDWINNTQLFIEVEDVEAYYVQVQQLELTKKYSSARLIPIRYTDWGSEFFLHDPAGILWHFGNFK